MKKYVSNENLAKFLQKLKGLFAKKSEAISQDTADGRYLKLSGGMMTGSIDLGNIALKSYGYYVLGQNSASVTVGNSDRQAQIQSKPNSDVSHLRGNSSYVMLDTYNTAANPTLAGTEANLTGLKVNGMSYKVPQGMENPMTTAGDIIYGGSSGIPERLEGSSTNGVPLKYSTSSGKPIWGKLTTSGIAGDNNGGHFLKSGTSGQATEWSYVEAGMIYTYEPSTSNKVVAAGTGNYCTMKTVGTDIPIAYLTTAPSADNTDGLKIVVLSAEPVQKFSGFLYVVLS